MEYMEQMMQQQMEASEYHQEQFYNSIASNIISNIEQEEVLVNIEDLFYDNGTHITKKDYGKILIKNLCNTLREKFIIKKG